MKNLGDLFFRKNFCKKKHFYGQATVEYLLLTALVVGLLLSIYQKRVKELVSNFTSRRTQYTDVVQQKTLGIPLAWFSGKFGNIDGNSGGGSNSGSGKTNSGATNQGSDGELNGGETEGALNSGNTAGNSPSSRNGKKNGPKGSGSEGDTSGSGDSSGGDGSGASGSSADFASNNSKNGAGKSGSKNRNQGGIGLDEADGSEEVSGRSTRKRGSTVIQSEGSVGADDKNKEKKQGEAQETKIKDQKEKRGDEELQKMKELYGSNKDGTREGGCAKVDLSAMIKVALIVGLLFVLFGMLVQNKGDGQD